jgi:hypothetical protein
MRAMQKLPVAVLIAARNAAFEANMHASRIAIATDEQEWRDTEDGFQRVHAALSDVVRSRNIVCGRPEFSTPNTRRRERRKTPGGGE